MAQEEVTFVPGERSRDLFQKIWSSANNQSMKEFFDLWEAEGDPRRAGSMMAHKFVRLGARFAVFGAACAGRTPDIDLWMEVCRERAEEAINEVGAAFARVETTGES